MIYKVYIKRILDIIGSLLAVPLFILLFIPIALLIKCEDGGPIFYLSERIGKGMQDFKMIKFRSMVVDAPDIRNVDGSTFNNSLDSRQTKVGKVLRRTSLDEIPQIFNVIKGEMSIVGPRPSPHGNQHRYSADYLDKFKIRPGITGYAQAYYRNDIDCKTREKYDLHYVNHISFKMDFLILLKTIKTVLSRKGVYRNVD